MSISKGAPFYIIIIPLYAIKCGLRFRVRLHFQIYRVLAYMPKPGDTDVADTLLPEGIENTSLRNGIVHRNNWMLDRCKYVIAYVTHFFSGAYMSVERAKLHGKTIILLTSPQNYGNVIC